MNITIDLNENELAVMDKFLDIVVRTEGKRACYEVMHFENKLRQAVEEVNRKLQVVPTRQAAEEQAAELAEVQKD